MLIINASQIITCASGTQIPRKGRRMGEVGVLGKGNAVLIEGSRIVSVGREGDLRRGVKKADIADARGGVVIPGFVDSHTHMAFGAPRLQDFSLRAAGAGYEEIAQKGGGILRSVRDLRGLSQRDLEERMGHWAGKALSLGTTTAEVKSGYGLNLKEEEKILKAVQNARRKTSLELVSTFLGAHALGPEYQGRRARYLKKISEEMLPRFKNLADFCDVFCDRGYFTLEESRRLLEKAQKIGYRLKLHADQLSRTGAADLGAVLGAASVDHLDHVSPSGVHRLSRSDTVCALVPGSNFFLGKKEYPPARRLIEAGCAVALATDFNPGTCPTLSMPMILSIAVMQMKMTVEESLCGATINGACALGLGGRMGSIEPGKQADLIITECRDFREIPYYFAMNPVRTVIKKGKVVCGG